jgi:hypothetical protein
MPGALSPPSATGGSGDRRASAKATTNTAGRKQRTKKLFMSKAPTWVR